MKIGYAVSNYPAVRNIIGKASGHDYVKVHDVHRQVFRAAKALERLTGRNFDLTVDNQFSFNDFGVNKVDVLHLFNAVSFGRTPWITTFETLVPRFSATRNCHHGRDCLYGDLSTSKTVVAAIRALSSRSCRGIIALSDCARTMQLDFVRNCFPRDFDAIEAKLRVIHPPQRPLVEACRDKRMPGELRLMLVGSSFVRKGGREVIAAVQDFRRRSACDVRLTIVSALAIDDYATRETQADIDAVKQVIDQNAAWITHHPRLPNDEVIALMKASHVGLLPTYADTYGFSVLEFQATGCPVITTDVRALPEINTDEVGWVIPVPKNRLGEASYGSAEGRSTISAAIREGLRSALEDIVASADRLHVKSMAALERIRVAHDPDRFSRELGEMYRAAAH